MSLYTFATDNLTTFADLRRRPAIDIGQLVRTLSLFIAFAIASGTVAHRSQAADGLATEIQAGTSAATR